MAHTVRMIADYIIHLNGDEPAEGTLLPERPISDGRLGSYLILYFFALGKPKAEP